MNIRMRIRSKIFDLKKWIKDRKVAFIAIGLAVALIALSSWVLSNMLVEWHYNEFIAPLVSQNLK